MLYRQRELIFISLVVSRVETNESWRRLTDPRYTPTHYAFSYTSYCVS